GVRDFHVTGVQTCALPICGEELSDNLAGKFKSFGYEVKLYYRNQPQDNKDNEIDAVVVYTYEGSDAAAQGLERGLWIREVNGQRSGERRVGSGGGSRTTRM